MKYYLKVLKDYIVFKGRASRSEYWYFVLFNIIFSIAAMIIDNILSTKFTIDTTYGAETLPYGYVYLVYALLVLIPG